MTKLTEIHRQAEGSSILQYAHTINNGERSEAQPGNILSNIYELDLLANEHFHFLGLPQDADLPLVVKGVVHTIINEKFGLNDGVKDCQILTPTNNLKERINQVFQGLNQSPFISQIKTSKQFKINDKVVQT